MCVFKLVAIWSAVLFVSWVNVWRGFFFKRFQIGSCEVSISFQSVEKRIKSAENIPACSSPTRRANSLWWGFSIKLCLITFPQTVTLNKTLFRTIHIYTDSKQAISTPVSYYQPNDVDDQNTWQRAADSQSGSVGGRLILLRGLSDTELHLLLAGVEKSVSAVMKSHGLT